MSFCSQCGAELHGPFCTQCGAAQTAEAEARRAAAANPYEAGSQAPSNPYSGESEVLPLDDPTAPNIPGFFGAFAVCFYKYAEPRGRASRSEFWFFALWFFLALVLLIVLIKASSGPVDPVLLRRSPTALSSALTWIGWPIILALFVPLCFSACRRLHDSNKSGDFFGIGLSIGVGACVATELTRWPYPTTALLLAFCTFAFWMFFLAILTMRLAARPTPGPNKYGPQPWKRRQTADGL